jgi:hypothetical protein
LETTSIIRPKYEADSAAESVEREFGWRCSIYMYVFLSMLISGDPASPSDQTALPPANDINQVSEKLLPLASEVKPQGVVDGPSEWPDKSGARQVAT